MKTIAKGALLFFMVASAVLLGLSSQAKDNSWGQITDPSQRYKALANFGNAAVLDRETGLIWEACPDTATKTWPLAQDACWDKNVGGRLGWRMPTFEEMASLGDPGASPFLPNTGPFCSTASRACDQGGCGPDYWTTTLDPNPALGSSFKGIISGSGPGININANPQIGAQASYWCVRGGQFHDANP